MSAPAPHFVLFSETSRKQRQGQWRFLLKAVDGSEQLEVEDDEPEARGERLELLAVVRGLEALDQPSRVTLVTSSKYVHRGLLYGLQEWRSNDWSWERFGEMTPVKNRDLWQRLDHALAYHELDFRPWRFDAAAPCDRLTATPLADAPDVADAGPAVGPAASTPAGPHYRLAAAARACLATSETLSRPQEVGAPARQPRRIDLRSGLGPADAALAASGVGAAGATVAANPARDSQAHPIANSDFDNSAPVVGDRDERDAGWWGAVRRRALGAMSRVFPLHAGAV